MVPTAALARCGDLYVCDVITQVRAAQRLAPALVDMCVCVCGNVPMPIATREVEVSKVARIMESVRSQGSIGSNSGPHLGSKLGSKHRLSCRATPVFQSMGIAQCISQESSRSAILHQVLIDGNGISREELPASPERGKGVYLGSVESRLRFSFCTILEDVVYTSRLIFVRALSSNALRRMLHTT